MTRMTVARIARPLLVLPITLLALAPLTARPAAAQVAHSGTWHVINFDNLHAPCDFDKTQPLTTLYQEQGVTFAGPAAGSGGAILNQCANFGVSGYSPPNFLAFNTGTGYAEGSASGPETISFSTPVKSVYLKVGSDFVSTIVLIAYNGNRQVDRRTIRSNSTLRYLGVDGNAITSVQLGFTAQTLVADDLTWK